MAARKNKGTELEIPLVNGDELIDVEEPTAEPGSKVTARVIKPQATGASELLDSKRFLRVLTEVKNGNFSVRLPIDETGVTGKICDVMNEIISLNEKMINEFTKAG